MRTLTINEVDVVSGGTESEFFGGLAVALDAGAVACEEGGLAADATVVGAPVGLFLAVGGAVMGAVALGIEFFLAPQQ